MHAPDRHGWGLWRGRRTFLRSDELSRAGEGSQWWGRGCSWKLDLRGEEGERCRAGSSLWGWHGVTVPSSRPCLEAGGAWVCGEKQVASAEVSRGRGHRLRPPDTQPGMACNGREMRAPPDGQLLSQCPLPPHAGKLLPPLTVLLPLQGTL